ncbi:MAG: S26 family signal peptidase [Caulobacterales bacterium]|nr:S26 family signal peptidase [Caulobacterales bacterium]
MPSALDVRRLRPLVVAALLIGGLAALTALNVSGPVVLANTTASEPKGLYVRRPGPIVVGALVAFRTPDAAFPYADHKLAYLRHRPILKAVAAGPGDLVCTTTGRLVINGADRAAIWRIDGEGRALPRWEGCRRLHSDEVFAFSNRVPNSFDSRYFGPVSRNAVIGVFLPLRLPTEAS